MAGSTDWYRARLATLHLSGNVVIPEGRDLGPGQPRGDHRDQSFAASEGWDLRELQPGGVFYIRREGMSAPVHVGGLGYSYTELREQVTPPEPVQPRRKR